MMKKNNSTKKNNLFKKKSNPYVSKCRFTTQESIPIYTIHHKYNLIETYPGLFTKMYRITDNNYMTDSEDDRNKIFAGYRAFLNSCGYNCDIAISEYNKQINLDDFKAVATKKETGDKYDYLRRQLNDIIINRINEGKNGLQKYKYITIGLHATDVKKAAIVFEEKLDPEIKKSFLNMSSGIDIIKMPERLSILYGIYNITDQNNLFDRLANYDFDNLRSTGCTIADMISPSSIRYYDRYGRIGSKVYFRSMRVKSYPSAMTEDFVDKLLDVDFPVLSTVNMFRISDRDANTLIGTNIMLAKNEKNSELRKISQTSPYLDPETMIRDSTEEHVTFAENLRTEMIENDEKLFYTVHTIIFWASSLEDLQIRGDAIISNCQAVGGVVLDTMDGQQEAAYNATLPLCDVELPDEQRRILKSTSLATVSFPFSNLEVFEQDGINYAINSNSKNLIVYNRLNHPSYNGFIIGQTGSGKSFAAKWEMLNVMLGSNADLIVIDPDNEYEAMAILLGGEYRNIRPKGHVYINPMDIFADYKYYNNDDEMNNSDSDDVNPVYSKSSYIIKLIETMINSTKDSSTIYKPLDEVEKTIIDRSVTALYAPFIDADGKLTKIPADKMPTLTDLQTEILRERRNDTENETKELYYALERYVHGTLDIFGHQSNIDTNNRFIVYGVRDVDDELKPVTMLIILDSIFSLLVKNKSLGKYTWYWVDEIHLLFRDERTLSTLNMLFKRNRKYGGAATGITQNISDLLTNETANAMLANCYFIQMLHQAPSDLAKVMDLFNFSESQRTVLENSTHGQGVIFTGHDSVPFVSDLPEDNDIFRCLDSNMEHIRKYKEEERKRQIIAHKQSKTEGDK